MKILIIVGILCIILYVIRQTEGFEDPIDPELLKKYTTFVAFYNPFLINWEKAIVTSIGLDTPIKALTDPSQVGSASASFTAPTRIEMNAYIQNLEKTLNKPFPPLTDALPSTLDSALITELSQRPLDPSAYQNALQWMNKSLSAAHTQMDAMKKSPEGFNSVNRYKSKEGFDNCAEYTKCMSDPEVLSKIAEAQNEQQAKKENEKRKALEDKLDKINNDSIIQSEAANNMVLVQKSKEVEEQAKSGALLNQFNLTNNDDSLSHFVKPSGVAKLEDMKKNNPAQYAANEKNNGQILALGTLLNSISRSLG
jgi:hypothetical protein